MNKKDKNYHPERGSAILWILVAVGLFAALNYAFNSSSRTSTSLLSDAEAEAYANQIIQYGNEVKATVKRLQLRGCSDTEISFENDVVTGYENLNAPDDGSCDVFNIAGGGLNWKSPPSSSLDRALNSNEAFGQYFFSGRAQILDIGQNCGNENCNELLMLVGFLNSTQCEILNKQYTHDSDIIINESINQVPPDNNDIFVGIYDFSNSPVIGDTAASLAKQSAGCVKRGNSTYGYTYYHVLIAR